MIDIIIYQKISTAIVGKIEFIKEVRWLSIPFFHFSTQTSFNRLNSSSCV